MGTVSAELTETPGSVQCILFRLTRASFVRQVTLNVSAGQSTASVSLGTLAAGSYTLTADAYSQACSTSTITWTADSTTVAVRPGVYSRVNMTFREILPVEAVADFVSSAVQVASGSGRTVVLLADGRVREAGDGLPGTRAVPGIGGVVEVCVGYQHACGRRANGSVSCWGDNSQWQYGALAATPGAPTTRTAPLQDLTFASGFKARRIACKGNVTAVLLEDAVTGAYGRVWLTGNAFPAYNGTNSPYFSAPELNAEEIALRSNVLVVMEQGHGIKHWVISAAGLASTPYTTVAQAIWPLFEEEAQEQVATGQSSTLCGTNQQRRLWCAADLDVAADAVLMSPEFGSVVSLAVPDQSSVCAVDTSGALRCTGGLLGDGFYTQQVSVWNPQMAVATPIPVSVGGPVAQVAGGHRYACAVRRDGEVYCWGNNEYGQLGDGTLHNRYTPTRMRF